MYKKVKTKSANLIINIIKKIKILKNMLLKIKEFSLKTK